MKTLPVWLWFGNLRERKPSLVVAKVMDCGNLYPGRVKANGGRPCVPAVHRSAGLNVLQVEVSELVFIRPGEFDRVATTEGKKVLAVDMRLHFLDLVDVDYGRAMNSL